MSSESKPDRTCIIGRGKCGWHASGISRWGTFSSSGGELAKYASEAPEGCPVYDAREADTDAFASLIISGPMVDARLSAGEIKPFGEKEKRAALGMLGPGGLSGGYETLVAMAIAGLGSLDSVAPDVYIQLLREKVPGVRIGRVEEGRVIWE